jgi:hypothetical protein
VTRLRVTLLASALAFAGPGAGFLLAPEWFAARVDLRLGSATAFSDVRAVFGGLEIAIAALLAGCALAPGWQRTGLAIQLATLGGLLGGRLASLARDGAPGGVGWLLFAIEAALFAAGCAAAIQRPDAAPPRH